MLSDREREAVRIGKQALDQALVSLDCPPVPDNPDFRVTQSGVGDLPYTVLEKQGVAPLRFMYWPENLDVWVGPYSEVLVARFSDAGKENGPQRLIEELLQSSVLSRRRTWQLEITLQRSGHEPWHRLKIIQRRSQPTLEPVYQPYVG